MRRTKSVPERDERVVNSNKLPDIIQGDVRMRNMLIMIMTPFLLSPTVVDERERKPFKEKFFLLKWSDDADHRRLPLDKNELHPVRREHLTF
jgi:hypothetical protein